jgi:hypothetical protein
VKRDTLLASLDQKARSDLIPNNFNVKINLGKKIKPKGGDTLPETLGDEDDVPDEGNETSFLKY